MKFKKSKKKPLPIEVNELEFTELLEATRSMHHKVAFLLAWESGLRISEITNLKPEDFDLERGTIRVNCGKGGKDRIVGLPASWMSHLLKYIPIKCSNRAIQKAFEMYRKRTGLRKKKPKVHFHSLRHGYATYLRRKGVSIDHIQKLLGHSDISTTMIYVNLAPEEAIKVHKGAYR